MLRWRALPGCSEAPSILTRAHPDDAAEARGERRGRLKSDGEADLRDRQLALCKQLARGSIREAATSASLYAIPANAGTHCAIERAAETWIPAFAGMAQLAMTIAS